MSSSFWSALFETFEDSLTQDYRDDPAYKAKLQELIERNKQSEEEGNAQATPTGPGSSASKG